MVPYFEALLHASCIANAQCVYNPLQGCTFPVYATVVTCEIGLPDAVCCSVYGNCGNSVFLHFVACQHRVKENKSAIWHNKVHLSD